MKAIENNTIDIKKGIFVKTKTWKYKNDLHGNQFYYELFNVKSGQLLFTSDTKRKCGGSNVATFIACVWTIQKLFEKNILDATVYTNSTVAVCWYNERECGADLASSLNTFGRETVKELVAWLRRVNPEIRLQFLREADFKANYQRK